MKNDQPTVDAVGFFRNFALMKPIRPFFYIVIAAILFPTIGCTSSTEERAHDYIAHGGGSIDGYLCTNSLEAVENALANGIDYVELDLALTTDSLLVATHDWSFFRETAGFTPSDEAVDSSTFVNAKIYGLYTPLTAREIVQLLERHPSMTLVTDKVSDPEIIDRYFSGFRDRVIVESFSRRDYNALNALGYRSFNNGKPPYSPVYRLKELLNFVRPNVRNYSLSVSAFKEKFDGKPRWLYPDECAIALYTAAGRQEADSLFAAYPNVRFVYIDDVEKK